MLIEKKNINKIAYQGEVDYKTKNVFVSINAKGINLGKDYCEAFFRMVSSVDATPWVYMTLRLKTKENTVVEKKTKMFSLPSLNQSRDAFFEDEELVQVTQKPTWTDEYDNHRQEIDLKFKSISKYSDIENIKIYYCYHMI